MKRRLTEYRFNGLIALLLFGVFAVCVLGVLLTGADAYRRLTERDKDAYNRRTYVQYMATRVRQAAGAGSVSVEDFGGEDALVLLDGKGWATRVYYGTVYGGRFPVRAGSRTESNGSRGAGNVFKGWTTVGYMHRYRGKAEQPAIVSQGEEQR